MNSTFSSICQESALGGLAGLAATVPMTATMEWMNRRLPGHEPFPPRMATVRAAEKAGVEPHLDETQKQVGTMLAHFGMGTALGAIYGLAGRRIPLGPTASGAAFGLLAYGANYLGLLPGIGLMAPATDYPPRRNVLLIVSHLVWGAVAANVTERLLPGPHR